ncbi:hypothetical protein FE257_010284 [Aspergillus nanangensis]|uniref:Telomeric single stranded DNA binding POT1/Cdc13 domain-containing protein n=1 Tax=Aspergillus nanangensis TaxID=2582783 RepID=A0AAD4CIQ2_ASPNN|nr:hypothetical protein FE257_010284 [Aspergillus nanangensis]
MDGNAPFPTTSEHLHPNKIPIAQVSPTDISLSKSSVHAAITLLWPYSSSTKTLGLLLAEPDFLLRRSNGQVKVIFHGHVAENVAKSKVGIGDEVYLSLEGARFVNNETTTQTPGKCIAWDLHFDDRVLLEISHSSELLSVVKVDPPSSPLPNIRVTSPTPVTPTPKEIFRIDGTQPATNRESWQSPAFLGQSRNSFGPVINTAFDPFSEEDGYVPGKGRKRPRFSMGGNAWRVIDEPESPGEKDIPLDWAHFFDEEDMQSDNEREGTVNADRKSPKLSDHAPENVESTLHVTRSAEMDLSNIPSSFDQGQHADQTGATGGFIQPLRQPHFAYIPVDTPRLHPIPSPGLPIPSPIATTSSSQQGYFGSAIFTNQARLDSRVAGLSQEMQGFTAGNPQSEHDESHMMDLDEAGAGSHVVQSSTLATITTDIQFDDVEEVPEHIAHNNGSIEPTDTDMIAETAVHLSSNIEKEAHRTASEEGYEEADAETSYHRVQDDDMEGFERRQSEEGESEPSESRDGDDGIEDMLELNEREVDKNISDHSISPVTEIHNRVQKEYDDVSQTYEYEEDQEDNEYGTDEEGYYRVESGEESFGEDEYEEASVSEYESDQISVEDAVPPQAPKHVHPEIIVLDSDSEDEPPPSLPAQAPNPTNEPWAPTASEDDESIPGEQVPGAEYDDWSEADESPRSEGIEAERRHSEQKDDEDVEATSAVDELMSSQGSESESLEDEWQEDKQLEDSSVDEVHVDHEEMDFEDQQHSIEGKPSVVMPSQYDDGEGMEVQGYSEAFTATHHSNVGRLALSPRHYASNQDFAERSIGGAQDGQEPMVHAIEVAIDPELYNLTPTQEPAAMETGHFAEQYKGISQLEQPKPDSDTEKDPQGNNHLTLDGAAPSLPERSTINVISETPALTSQPITPEQSQLIDATQGVPKEGDTAQLLPTPIHTQLSTSQVLPEETTPMVENFQDEIRILQTSEHSLHQSIEGLVQGPTEAQTTHADRPLQSQSVIGDDDSIGTVDSVHLVSIDRHYPGLRSKLSYFAPLATLVDHYNALTDTMSVVSQVYPVTRATSGKKDHSLSLQLTDPSMAGTTLSVEISRPYKAALPAPQEGDAILLRNFMVRSLDHLMMLVSVGTSSWAVFSSAKNEAQVNGPPVEYGKEEQSLANDLRQWYQENGIAMVADNQLQASIDRASREATPASLSDSGSIDSALRDMRGDSSISSTRSSRRSRRSHRRITIHELRDGTRYTEVGSPSGKDSIHELRDGTVYAHL